MHLALASSKPHLAGVIAVAAVLLTACGSGQPQIPPTPFSAAEPTASPTQTPPLPTATPQVKQELVWASTAFPLSTDPHSTSSSFGQGMYQLVFDTLLRQGPKGEFEPLVAESWQQIDPTTVQFKLRSGLKFHDGEELTAKDVKFSFDRVVEDKTPLAVRIPGIRVDVVDEQTLNVVTKGPDPLLLRRVARIYILPQEYWARVGKDSFVQTPVGSGPFRLDSFKPNASYTLVRSDHPVRKPKLTKITEKAIPDLIARTAALKAGEVDLIETSAEQLKAFERSPIKTLVADRALMQVYMLGLDDAKGGPTADKRVRQAINYAVDKEALKKQLFGGFASNTGQVTTPGVFGYNPEVKPYPYDPVRARTLLAEAGFANGFQTRMEYLDQEPFRDVALKVQKFLKDVGIVAEAIPMDRPTFIQKLNNGPRAPLFFLGLSTEPVLDADFALLWFNGKRKEGQHFFNNPRFNELYEQSKTELDPARREELLKQLAEIMADDPPALYLVSLSQFWAHKPEVSGFQPPLDGFPWLESVSKRR